MARKGSESKLLDGIQFRRSRRARHLSIRIKPYQGVQVSVPQGMSYAAAERLVLKKRDWIIRTLKKAQALESHSPIYDGTRAVATRRHKLVVNPGKYESVRFKIGKGEIRVTHPDSLPMTAPEIQAVIGKGLIAAYRAEAKQALPVRLDELARQHGFKYNQVFIKNHRSRWGSCSAKNNINLSLHLMRLPDHLVDYVLLHELVHTEIKNHSARFWRRLQDICPQTQSLRKELRQKTRELRPLHG